MTCQTCSDCCELRVLLQLRWHGCWWLLDIVMHFCTFFCCYCWDQCQQYYISLATDHNFISSLSVRQMAHTSAAEANAQAWFSVDAAEWLMLTDDAKAETDYSEAPAKVVYIYVCLCVYVYCEVIDIFFCVNSMKDDVSTVLPLKTSLPCQLLEQVRAQSAASCTGQKKDTHPFEQKWIDSNVLPNSSDLDRDKCCAPGQQKHLEGSVQPCSCRWCGSNLASRSAIWRFAPSW